MMIAVATKAIASDAADCVGNAKLTIAGVIKRPTRFITLISGLIAGPAVSLNGSPTVSPTTVAACASVPFSAVVSIFNHLLRVIPRAARV
jgi:hypothetical protein